MPKESKEKAIKIRFLKVSEVADLTSYSVDSIRRLSDAGTFPPPRKIGDRRQAWLESEVLEWLQEKVGVQEKITLPHVYSHYNRGKRRAL